MRLVLALLVLSLAVSLPAAPSPTCTEIASSRQRVTLDSPRAGRGFMVTVILPPCAEEHTPLPYAVLLGGSNRDDNHWVDLDVAGKLEIGIADKTLPYMAIVLPYGEQLANANQFGPDSWGEVIYHDLIPAAEAQFGLDPSRRAIGGISRGGFWAYQIGLRYPDQFVAIGGHSAFFDLYHAPDDQNPLDLALVVQNPPPLYLDRGIDDYAAPGLDIMDARLKEARIAHTYIINPAGQHNDAYWSAHIADYLAFYGANLAPTSAPVVFATRTPPPQQGMGLALFVPVAAFPSRVFNLPRAQFDALLRGEDDPKLTITHATRDALFAYGRPLHPNIRTVDDDAALLNDLYRDRTRWAIVPWDAVNLRLRVLWIDEQHPLYALDTYPLAMASYTPNYDPDKLTTVMLSGVTAMARNVTPALDEHGVDWAAELIAPYTTRADVFHVSNEVSAVADCPRGGERLGGGNSMCTKPEHFDVFDRLGVDVVELSGNHNNDYGYGAYRDTLRLFHDKGFSTIGGGETILDAQRPLIIERDGNRIAWLSCNLPGPYYAHVGGSQNRPGAAPCDTAWLRAVLPPLKAENDVVILSLQYWEFDQYAPTDQQRIDFANYARLGADVVIGTQAHFPQTYNVITGYGEGTAFLHYGIGNFLFDQSWWAGVRFSLDELYIYDGRLMTVAIYPGIIEENARPRLMTAEERDNFLYVLMVEHGVF